MKTLFWIFLTIILLAVFGPTIVGFIISLLAVVLVPLLVIVLLGGIAFVVGTALFGSVALATAIAACVLVLVGFSFFWPIILIALLIVWLFSRSRTQTV